ncbi:electron transfer flavoprotein subunit alpha/FixB family protein [Saccharospirillum alexandrii]|uniref:electron transfer flavoprotein subunit alpha/FixB family protein n=1 Tax=Saccharospirillum alexandrii TaxID=2448477 RepID=UPI000FDA7B29|nr:electron transfer flavoprotein subunit alpha/FixB family protein [Saccharospirillum alexandrii]
MSLRIRRNPRLERIRRNRLHPEYTALMAATVPAIGPTGLRRINPHQTGFVMVQGRKRLNRLNPGGVGFATSSQPGQAQAKEKPLHSVTDPRGYVAVVMDLPGGRLSSHDRDVLGLAQQLAQAKDDPHAVLAIALGDVRETDLGGAGADRVIQLSQLHTEPLTGYCPELKLSILTEIEKHYQPAYWLFPDSIDGGADLGSRWAVQQHERAAVQAWQVNKENTVCRGGSQLTDWHRPTPRVLLLAPECAAPVEEYRYEALPLELTPPEPISATIEDRGPVSVDPSQIALSEAEFILAAGNGVRNWDQFHQVATVLGATEGASRVAVDDGYMPRHRQVGASGTWVSARVYLAVGISGAIQHLQGIGQCETVIAVNLDAGCDMVRRADLTVIADSEAVFAELLNLMTERQTGVSHQSDTADEGEARHVA